jgi:hypothetical protein
LLLPASLSINVRKIKLKPEILVRARPPRPSPIFETYWQFAARRQSIYFKRIGGAAPPWTDDPILASYKFTNAYRAADRVSQYLIKEVLYQRSSTFRDQFFRTLLFKLFNRIETWELLTSGLGTIELKSFDWRAADQILSDAQARGIRIYSGAYIIPSAPSEIRPAKKHRTHLQLLRSALNSRIDGRIERATSLASVYKALTSLPSIGPFLGFQFAIDLNYSDALSFSEMDFVVAGPGALDGLRKCFIDLGEYSEVDVIRWIAERQDYEFQRRGIHFQSLWGRQLQLIDCQNLLCEVDKYSRAAHPDVLGRSGRTRIKQRFRSNPTFPPPWFPPKWGINNQIKL